MSDGGGTYTDRELEIYHRGRDAGYAAGRIQGISEAIMAMTNAGRALAKQARPRRRPLHIRDLINALMEST